MRFDLKKRRLVAKEEEQRKKVVIDTKEYVSCHKCEGTGLERDDQYSWNCRVCNGRGEIMTSSKREIQTK